jgi:hypothetical protein
VSLSQASPKPISKTISFTDTLLVPACRLSRLYGSSIERGLVAIDSNGITYLSLAKSEANRIITIMELIITTALLVFGIISGYNYLLFILPVWLIKWLISLALTSTMKVRALKQENIAVMSGLASIKTMENQLHADWNEIETVSLKRWAYSASVIIKLINGAKFTFLLVGKDKVLNITSKSEALDAIQNAFNHYASNKLKPG